MSTLQERVDAARLARGLDTPQEQAARKVERHKKAEATAARDQIMSVVHLCIGLGLLALVAWVFMVLWNAVIPSLKGPAMDYNQAFGVLVLLLFLKWLLRLKKA